MHPVEYAEELASKLPNVPGGSKLFVVKGWLQFPRLHAHVSLMPLRFAGGPEYITIVPYCSSVINRVFAAFISELPSRFPASAVYSFDSTPPPSPLHQALRSRGPSIPPMPIHPSATPHIYTLPSSLSSEELAERIRVRDERMREALDFMADLAGDESIKARDSGLANSFTRTDEETQKRHWEMIEIFKEGEDQAVSTLGSDGRPLRK